MHFKRLLLAVVLFTGVGRLAAAEVAGAGFPAFLDRYYEDFLVLFPVDAAISGDADNRYEAVWQNDISAGRRLLVAAWCDQQLAGLAKFDRAALGPSEQLSYDTLKWDLEMRREGTKQLFALLPVNQFYSPTLLFAQLASGTYIQPFKTAQDYRNFLSRARGFSTWVDDAIANLREGVARGIVQPRILMERTLPQLDSLAADDEKDNVLFGALKVLPANLPPEERAALADEYRAGVRTIMLPAYRRLADFIRREYLPKCRETAGIGAVPGGAAAYAYAVRLQTTTDLTPAEIHALGLREVARVRGEMEKVRAQVGFPGSLADFLHYVATDPKFAPFKTQEEVLNAYRAIEGRVMAKVPLLFDQVPHIKFEIRATEAFRAASASAEYSQGAADGSRPGIFYVPIPDPAEFRTPRMEDLFLHEAIPGHHFQLSLALENTHLPRFRRYDANNAYVEGWALYCETLGPELGMYTDPYQYLGLLFGEMHRAIRLVVDTGLHEYGWSRAKALAYAAENEGGSDEQNQSEIERNMAWPGQALGYKIGQLKIRELRHLAEQTLGTKFDVRKFHDEILTEGSLPLAVLDTRVRAWIDAGGR